MGEDKGGQGFYFVIKGDAKRENVPEVGCGRDLSQATATGFRQLLPEPPLGPGGEQ